MAAEKHWIKEDKNVNYFHLIQMIAFFENSGIIRHTGALNPFSVVKSFFSIIV